MSRSRNQKRKQSRKNQNKELIVEQERGLGAEDVVYDTAAVYTCFHEVVQDYAQQCNAARESFEADVVFTQLAHEIWRDRPGRAEQLSSALVDFLLERRRYLTAVAELEPRFRALIDPPLHEHLEPIEHYRELTHRRLFPHEFDPPALD